MLDQWFGELRHLVQSADFETSPIWIENRDELQSLLIKAYLHNAEAYIDQWRPYLASFDHLPPLSAGDIETARLLLHIVPEPQTFIVKLEHTVQGGPPKPQWFMEPWVVRAKTISSSRAKLNIKHLECLLHRPLPQLELFFAYGNEFDDQCVELLAQSDLPQLKVLDWSSNPIGPKGIELLASSKTLPSLQKLLMGNLELNDECVRTLVHCPLMGQLEALRLNNCQLSDQALIDIARSPLSASLTYLSLDNNDIGPKGLKYLMDSPYLTRLIYLFLRQCDLDEEHAQHLRAHPSFDQLQHLFID